MTTRNSLLAVFLLILCSSTAGAGAKQEEGEQLIARALELSDIRAPRAGAFHLRATFQKLADGSEPGRYAETWISKEQWRRETELGNFRRIEVGGVQSKWLLDTGNSIPSGALLMYGALNRRIPPKGIKVKRIESKNVNGVPSRCVRVENENQIEVYCVEAKTELLLFYEFVSRRILKSHAAYLFGDYEKFGEHLFPRSINYESEAEGRIEIRVAEIERADPVDLTIFAPPPGAIELANCLQEEMKPPHVDFSPDPNFPDGQRSSSSLVVLSLIVGVDGRPNHIQVARTGGAAFDAEALSTVEKWRFRPPTCHDKPVAAQINVEVTFRR
jgi:TonB family protein